MKDYFVDDIIYDESKYEMLSYLIEEARELWTKQRIDDIGKKELRKAECIRLVEKVTKTKIEKVLKENT